MPEIRNPNLDSRGPSGGGGGGDMRGLMSFLFLAIAAVIAFQLFTKPQSPAPEQATQTQKQSQPAETAPAPTQSPSVNPVGTEKKTSSSSKTPSAPQAASTVAASSESDYTVENELYKIVFSNRGGVVKHWILKGAQYTDAPGGKQLDLVDEQTTGFGYPLSLYTYDASLDDLLNKAALYQVTVSGSGAQGHALVAPGSISFHYDANGVNVVKTFHFDASYVVTADVSVQRNGSPVRALISWPNGLGDQRNWRQYETGKIIWSIDGKDDNIKAKKVSNGATTEAAYQYAAVSDLYFAAAFLPDVPSRATVVTLNHGFEALSDASNPNSEKHASAVLGIAVGDTSGVTRLRIFAGPKQSDVLKSIHAMGPDGKPNGPNLEPLIQFGVLTVIAKPLYVILRWVRNLLGGGIDSWGWAIVLVTFVFNLIMLPTRVMMMKSSLRMMRIQPKTDAIKRKYAHLKINDPKRQEMNAEMMKLYKDEGVNMYGSCLPMLIQMPLFFAYFEMLENAVELRHAHWLWLTDLSAADPSHVLPILIIITMFLTTYITPSPGMDANQRRMMAFGMPIFMGFILFQYASGLALYWGTGNVINLAIQIGINKSSIGKEMHEIAARRAAKKSGKVIQGKK
ncbi:MAG: membrane protein insertase YidC [Acidobacteriota bacterium]|nr:membrane protein insertase YidC [Acidobacteriota bacterium]